MFADINGTDHGMGRGMIIIITIIMLVLLRARRTPRNGVCVSVRTAGPGRTHGNRGKGGDTGECMSLGAGECHREKGTTTITTMWNHNRIKKLVLFLKNVHHQTLLFSRVMVE